MVSAYPISLVRSPVRLGFFLPLSALPAYNSYQFTNRTASSSTQETHKDERCTQFSHPQLMGLLEPKEDLVYWRIDGKEDVSYRVLVYTSWLSRRWDWELANCSSVTDTHFVKIKITILTTLPKCWFLLLFGGYGQQRKRERHRSHFWPHGASMKCPDEVQQDNKYSVQPDGRTDF